MQIFELAKPSVNCLPFSFQISTDFPKLEKMKHILNLPDYILGGTEQSTITIEGIDSREPGT
jgi:hypothetical protein